MDLRGFSEQQQNEDHRTIRGIWNTVLDKSTLSFGFNCGT